MTIPTTTGDPSNILVVDESIIRKTLFICLEAEGHYVTAVSNFRRTNHDNPHVRGYKGENPITTPFEMTVLNDPDRFHPVMDTIDRLLHTGDKGVYRKKQLKDKLIEHKHCIDGQGQDMPEIRNRKWSRT